MARLEQKILNLVPQLFRKVINRRSYKLDPQMRFFLSFARFFKQAHECKSVEHARRSFSLLSKPGFRSHKDGMEVRNFFIEGSKRKIPVRLYLPPDFGPNSAVIMFMHGGGWVLGNLDSHNLVCKVLARDSGHAVLAIDYALAPESPFPAALYEGLDVYQWLMLHRSGLLGFSSPIIFCGDSAGGNLVTALCLLCKQKGLEQPKYQILFYPVTDLMGESSSRKEFAEGYLLSRKTMTWFEKNYAAGQILTNPLVSPLYAKDCSGLAPAIIYLAGFDILFDEGLLYARLLEQHGVRVDLNIMERQIHAFANLYGMLPSATEDFSLSIQKISQLNLID
ncbi:MAG: alpha/beta hydrolase fold domain-containing protein [Oligoflexales bacterium]